MWNLTGLEIEPRPLVPLAMLITTLIKCGLSLTMLLMFSRFSFNAQVDEFNFGQTYMFAFRQCVLAHTHAVMCSYDQWNTRSMECQRARTNT